MEKIIFIHNRAMGYRIPCFELLQKHFGNDITFWFYNEPDRPFPARYFAFLQLRIRFSLTVIFALLTDSTHKTVVLAGSHSYEIPFLALAARMRGKRLVYWTEMWDWGTMDWKNRIFRRVHAWIARHADAVAYPGQRTHAFYSKIGIPETKQFFAPNASSVTVTAPTDETLTYADDGRKRVLFIGRFLERKGLRFLIDAIQHLPEGQFHVYIAGSNIPSSLGNKSMHTPITVISNLQHEHVGYLLSHADVFVAPSTTATGTGEPWGLVINEAVACGIPVVATTAVAAAYDLIIPSHNGYVVPEQDSAKLASAIQEAVLLQKDRLLKASREKSMLYSYDHMAQGFIEAIEAARSHKLR